MKEVLVPEHAFVPHHQLVTAPASEPRAWLLVLHGIFGSGANWRTFARKLCAARPEWGAVLVDLRMHGGSTDAPGPHHVRAAAADLLALHQKLGRDGMPVRAVLGHSFGGKVALVYQHMLARTDKPLAQTWVIDASPGARPDAMTDPENSVVRVLAALSELPPSFPDRAAFVASMCARGFGEALARWLSMNLEPRGQEYVSRLQAPALESLLRDYYELDAWPIVEDLVHGPGQEPGSERLCVVLAGRDSAVDPGDRARLRGLAAAGEALLLATLEHAGHWVHVDAPDQLLEIVTAHIPAPA